MEDEFELDEDRVERLAIKISEEFEGKDTSTAQMAFDVIMGLVTYQGGQLLAAYPELTATEVKTAVDMAVGMAWLEYLEGGYIAETEEEKPEYTDNVIQLH